MARKKRNRQREKAQDDGWSFGLGITGLKLSQARRIQRILRQAGLRCWLDDKALFGPSEETRQAVDILARLGFPLPKIARDMLDEQHECTKIPRDPSPNI